MTVPVTGGAGAGGQREAERRGWQVAHWAVANASSLHIQRVTYAGREWTAGNTDSKWSPAGGAATKGAERAAGPVRITSGW